MNDLAGYPLVLALSDNAINNCLAVVSARTVDLPDYWDLSSGDDEAWALKVDDFDPPMIDFNTNIRNGCRLKMTVKTGNFSYETIQKNASGKKEIVEVKIPLNGITFFITTEVSSIQHQDFKDEVFQVQSLFADLTKVKTVTLESMSQELKAKVGGAIEVALKELIKQAIENIAKKNPQALLFGSVKIPPILDSNRTHGPLAPTASSYSVTKRLDNGGNYLDGTLNYLLWLDGANLPTGDAIGAFNEPLLLYDGSQQKYAPGTLVISDYALLEKIVKPALIEKYTNGDRKPSLTVDHRQGDTPAKLHLTDNNKYVREENGDNHFYITKLDMQGTTDHKFRLDYEYDARRDHWSGDIKKTAKGYTELTFSFVNGKIDASVNAPSPEVTDHTDKVARAFGDILTLGFDEIGIADRYKEARDQINSLGGSNLGSSIEKVLDLIELPGKAVFVFDQVELKNGNLYVRTRYNL